MSLVIDWHEVAKRHLHEIGWHPAEFVDAAVIRFARTGRGDVERTPAALFLRVGPYRVWFKIHEDVGLMKVLAVYGPRRKR